MRSCHGIANWPKKIIELPLAAEVNLSPGHLGRELAFAAVVKRRHESVSCLLIDAIKDVDAHSRTNGFLHDALWQSIEHGDVRMLGSLAQKGGGDSEIAPRCKNGNEFRRTALPRTCLEFRERDTPLSAALEKAMSK